MKTYYSLDFRAMTRKFQIYLNGITMQADTINIYICVVEYGHIWAAIRMKCLLE